MTNNGYFIRKADIKDIQSLIDHHCLMFEEIKILKAEKIDSEKFAKMKKSYRTKLEEELPKGLCHAWVVEDKNKKIVASGAVSVFSFVPVPDNLSYIGAYLHSMYTAKEHRGNKLATRIIEEVMLFCKEKKITRIMLKASDAGKSIYEAIGFKPVESIMDLKIT